MTESEIQSDIKATLKSLGFFVYDTSNAARANFRGAAQLGIPDLLVVNPEKKNCLIGIEVKTEKGKLKPKQIEAVEAGHYSIARSARDAVEIVSDSLPMDSFYASLCTQYLTWRKQ